MFKSVIPLNDLFVLQRYVMGIWRPSLVCSSTCRALSNRSTRPWSLLPRPSIHTALPGRPSPMLPSLCMEALAPSTAPRAPPAPLWKLRQTWHPGAALSQVDHCAYYGGWNTEEANTIRIHKIQNVPEYYWCTFWTLDIVVSLCTLIWQALFMDLSVWLWRPMKALPWKILLCMLQ